MKTFLQKGYKHHFKRIGQQTLHTIEQPQTTVVFAPHPDDETLGCGGTIISKVDAGTDVTIVFMTEGRNSHTQFISATQLMSIRKQEAVAASSMLGVKKDKVLFLDFEDGHLSDHYSDAVAKVSSILQTTNPDEVFIPYQLEPPPDHYITNRIVRAAIRATDSNPLIYEYPVWLWHHWPWVSLRQHTPPGTRSVINNTLTNFFGLRLLKTFRHAFFVGNVLERKAAALQQHKSQMTKLMPNSQWLTLPDVSHGEFLACFFQDYEIFQCYRL